MTVSRRGFLAFAATLTMIEAIEPRSYLAQALVSKEAIKFGRML
jgi:hypothetical protein